MQYPLFVCQAKAMCIYSKIVCVDVFFIINLSYYYRYLKMVNKAEELIDIFDDSLNASSIPKTYPIFSYKEAWECLLYRCICLIKLTV